MTMELTHDILVNLISSATYDSPWLGIDYDKDKCDGHLKSEDCPEDIAADILLAGGSIQFFDYYAEDAYDVHSSKGKWDADMRAAVYLVTLEDIKAGLQNAIGENFVYYGEVDKSWAKIDVIDLLEDEGAFDAYAADNLMQIILFREIVY